MPIKLYNSNILLKKWNKTATTTKIEISATQPAINIILHARQFVATNRCNHDYRDCMPDNMLPHAKNTLIVAIPQMEQHEFEGWMLFHLGNGLNVTPSNPLSHPVSPPPIPLRCEYNSVQSERYLKIPNQSIHGMIRRMNLKLGNVCTCWHDNTAINTTALSKLETYTCPFWYWYTKLASSPGHSQIFSCEIKSGSGLGTRLTQSYYSLQEMLIVRQQVCHMYEATPKPISNHPFQLSVLYLVIDTEAQQKFCLQLCSSTHACSSLITWRSRCFKSYNSM